MLKRTFAATAVSLSLCLATAAQAQGLTGSQVTGAIYCCTAPTEQYRATNLVTAVVGAGVEFPNGVFSSVIPGLTPVPADLDIGANSVSLHYLASATSEPGGFDGYVLSFQNAPTITDVTVDPSSTLMPSGLSFSGNTILINNAGRDLSPDSRLLLSVAVVPEPEKGAMMLGGLVALGALARRRSQRSHVMHRHSRAGGNP